MDAIGKSRLQWWGLALALGCTAAPAAQILKIAGSRKMMAITGVNPSSWSVNDGACIERDAANRVCGQVVKILPRGLIFSASTANHDFQAGENVTLRRGGRSVASQEYESTNSTVANSRRTSISGLRKNDVSIGVEFIQPTVHYQRAFGNHFALGIMPTYMDFSSLDGTLGGIGAHLTFSYYSKQPFKGWWFMAGLGYYSFTATLNATTTTAATSETGSTLSVISGIGYRWLFGRSGWNLGLAGGVQYLANPQTTSLQFSSVLPALTVDVGYAF